MGAVIASVNPKFDPNKIYRTHTWERFAKGQTLVGVDESDSDFASVEMQMGEKKHTLSAEEIPSHSHVNHTYTAGSYGSVVMNTGMGSGPYGVSTGATGGSGAHNNIQPSVTVYYWKRIA